VYESEEYLFNSQIVEIINENFIPIYVDADLRQDLTRKYLEGGWPSTTVLTPGGERLYGFSGPRPVGDMLVNLQQAIDNAKSNGFSNQVIYDYKKERVVIPSNNQLTNLVSGYSTHMFRSYDSVHGGFGSGQKFPQGRTLDFSLEMYELTGENRFLELVEHTLEGQYTSIDEIQTNYNIYDPVEGGFHRYGTQRDWTPPHYEKMLYDNARLLKAYAHLQKLTPDDKIVNEVVEKTNSYFVDNWYDAENGGFYGNTDVHGEHHYYAENPRPADKPRVEKTNTLIGMQSNLNISLPME